MKHARPICAVVCATTLASTLMVPLPALADEGVAASPAMQSASEVSEQAKQDAEASVANAPSSADEVNSALVESTGTASTVDDGTVADTTAQTANAATDAGVNASEAKVMNLFAYAPASASSTKQAIEIAGETQFDTAAEEALYAFSSSDYAIVANGISAVDALSATALAGAYDCPIVLASSDELPDATANALTQLGVKHVFVVGGTSAISDDVASQISQLVGENPVRLGGDDIIGTQLAIYDYGKDNGLWSDQVIVAQGIYSIADPTSVSSLAYKLHAPVFIADEDGTLPERSMERLENAQSFTRAIIIGGTSAVTDDTMAAVDDAIGNAPGDHRDAVRLGGRLLYDTSAEVARWAVSEGYLNWDNAAFTTGIHPTDALAGAPVQAHDDSVMLLVDDDYYNTIEAARDSGTEFTQIKFLGGTMAVTNQTRARARTLLGMNESTVTDYDTGMSLDSFANLESAQSARYNISSVYYTPDQIKNYADPSNYEYGTSNYLQFADLSQGYSGTSADELNDFIDRMCVYSEQNYGVTSRLRGTGAYFIEAAQRYDINEVYLLAHAAIESAWGCSQLSQRQYMNFFGIMAYDDAPDTATTEAQNNGWTTPERAILGGAYWISTNYIHPTVASASVSGDQNTLWKMRWDAARAATGEYPWHQYATSGTWAIGIAQVMGSFYATEGYSYDNTGLSFLIPSFS